MKKTAISIILLLCMVLSLLPFAAMAANEWSVQWNLSRTGALTVEGYGAIADNWVTQDARSSWLSQRAKIKTAELQSGFTAVGAGTFADCPNLTRVTLPATVTHISSGAFTGSSRISEVVYGGTEAAWKAAGGEQAGLPAGAKVTFGGAPAPAPTPAPTVSPKVTPTPVEKPESIKEGEWMLNWAMNGGELTVVGYGEIPNGYLNDSSSWKNQVSQVTDVDVQEYFSGVGTGVFQNHPNLKTVKLTARVTHIAANAFSGCGSITDVYYAGTQAAWKAAGGDRAGLPASAVVHFGGEPAPAPIPVVTPTPSAQPTPAPTAQPTPTPSTKPTPAPSDTPFVDVPADAYYAKAVDWAVKKTVTNGTDATHFSPDAVCTRAQVVTFLWRAMGSPAPTGRTSAFADVKPDDYFCSAVLWAVERGVTNGTDATHFSPDAACTRAQVVTFLWRAEGGKTVSAANPFADVPSDAYYAQSVLWAVSRNITNGTDAAHFSPDASCTRAQVVTFLYRDIAK